MLSVLVILFIVLTIVNGGYNDCKTTASNTEFRCARLFKRKSDSIEHDSWYRWACCKPKDGTCKDYGHSTEKFTDPVYVNLGSRTGVEKKPGLKINKNWLNCKSKELCTINPDTNFLQTKCEKGIHGEQKKLNAIVGSSRYVKIQNNPEVLWYEQHGHTCAYNAINNCLQDQQFNGNVAELDKLIHCGKMQLDIGQEVLAEKGLTMNYINQLEGAIGRQDIANIVHAVNKVDTNNAFHCVVLDLKGNGMNHGVTIKKIGGQYWYFDSNRANGAGTYQMGGRTYQGTQRVTTDLNTWITNLLKTSPADRAFVITNANTPYFPGAAKREYNDWLSYEHEREYKHDEVEHESDEYNEKQYNGINMVIFLEFIQTVFMLICLLIILFVCGGICGYMTAKLFGKAGETKQISDIQV